MEKHHLVTELIDWEKTKIPGFRSKQLIELSNGGLKLIKVDSGSTYPLHQHPDKTEYIYVLEGRPEIVIGDNIYHGKAGDFFTMPETSNHSIINNGNQDCILLVGAIKVK